jgi:hypothetical protein
MLDILNFIVNLIFLCIPIKKFYNFLRNKYITILYQEILLISFNVNQKKKSYIFLYLLILEIA